MLKALKYALLAATLATVMLDSFLAGLLVVAAGAVAGVLSLVRRERSAPLAACGLVVNVVLIGLFWHFEFYAIGFDQDGWAPR